MHFTNRWNQIIYGMWSPIYDLFIRFPPFSKGRSRAFELAEIPDGSNVLLVGIGTGEDLPFLKGADSLTGVDFNRLMLATAERKAERLGIPLTSVCCDAAELPFEAESFDAVVMTLIVSVVPHPRECLQEAMRVLRSGGRIVVFDKFVAPGKNPSLLRRICNLLTRVFGTDITRSWEPMSQGIGKTLVDEPVGFNEALRAVP